MRLRLWPLSLLSLTWACSPKTQLPETRPPGLQVDLSISGGMMPEGTSVHLSDSNCVYNHVVDFAEVEYFFQLESAAFDSLWETFRKEKFDLMKSHEEEIYDRGGSSIQISFEGTTLTVSDEGMQVLNAEWVPGFGACEKAILQIAAEAGKKQERKVSFHTDTAPLFPMKDSLSLVHWEMDSQVIWEWEKTSGIPIPLSVMDTSLFLLPGRHSLSFYIQGGAHHSHSSHSMFSTDSLSGDITLQFHPNEVLVY